MIIRRVVRSVALGSCACLALAGCSSDGDARVCADLVDTMNDGAASISAAAEDPATAGDELRSIADDLRTAAVGASAPIVSATDDLAGLYEAMAQGFESGDIPDMSGLESAATSLQEACS
jgi:hypothetical protein